MTNYEAISAMLYPYDVDKTLIEKQCIDFEVASEDVYDKSIKDTIARITIAILRNLLVLSSESDSGYSLSYSIEGLKKRIAAIAKDNELTDIAEEFNDRPSVTFLDLW
jgi:hypothetical protein